MPSSCQSILAISRRGRSDARKLLPARAALAKFGGMTLSRLTALILSLIVAAALIGQFILNGALPEMQNWGLRI